MEKVQCDKKKILLIASSGGHYQQLTMLFGLQDKYSVTVVTEATKINNQSDYYIKQINRREKLWLINLLVNTVVSTYLLIKINPKVIISTGALASIPMLCIGKILGKEIIFIESFAKVTTGTLTGRLVYKFADLFIVQWESMLEVYPNAKLGGGIY